MRALSWSILTGAVACIVTAPLSCHSSDDVASAGGGHASSSVASGQGPICSDILSLNDCVRCLEKHCCAEIVGCAIEGGCLGCLPAGMDPACDENVSFSEL